MPYGQGLNVAIGSKTFVRVNVLDGLCLKSLWKRPLNDQDARASLRNRALAHARVRWAPDTLEAKLREIYRKALKSKVPAIKMNSPEEDHDHSCS